MRKNALIALLLSVLSVSPAAAQIWTTVELPVDTRIFDVDMQGDTIWMSTHTSGLLGFDGEAWVLHLASDGGIRTDYYNYTVLVHSSGDKWIGRDERNAVDRLNDAGTFADKSDDTWSYYTYQDELTSKRVFSMAETPNGDVWFGQRDEAHDREGTVELLIEDAGGEETWYHYDNAWTPDSTSFSDDDVRALAVDGAGRLWIGYYASGVDVWDYGDPAVFADDSWVHYSSLNELPSDLVHALHADDYGRVWIGTLGGLSVYDPAADSVETLEGLPGFEIRAIDSDREGHVWVGTDQGVAMLYRDGTVGATYDTLNGLPKFEEISEIAVDRDYGGVWAVSVDESQSTALSFLDSGYGTERELIYVYPNPWREEAGEHEITVFGAPEGSRIKIIDMTGQELREIAGAEPFIWDTLDRHGNEVPSGVYLVRVETTEGEVHFTKAAVIR